MCKCSCTKLFTLAWIVALLALVTAGNSVSFADGCPTNCSANRFNIDVQADKSEIKNGDTVNYTVTAFNNLNPFTDGCDAGVSSCNSVSGHGVIVQLCCPSPTGAAYPLFDFAPSHCTELSTATVGDNFPAGGGGTLKVYPPVPCVVTLNSGLTQATANAAGGDATNPNTPDPARGTIHFPAGDKGVQGSKPIPVIVDICGDGTINQTCETCDGSAFPSTAPSSHGACRTGQDTCGVIGCTFCGDGIVNGGEACDDGNAIDTDSCRNNCTLPTCGDGIINQTCETCDTNAFPSTAPSTHGPCLTGANCGIDGCVFCGDGIKNGNEQCDDGNAIDTDSCHNNCTLALCGNGIIDQTCETCDTNAFPSTAPSTHGPCLTGATCGTDACVFCGDGIKNGNEQCDDGNAIDTDGCRNNCTLTTCGDGIINQTCETCDTNAFPSTAPSTHGACRTGATCGDTGCTFCGDGIVNGGEQCDDGNAVDTDNCRNDCTTPVAEFFCRTPGFWGTHADADCSKPCSQDITAAVLAKAGPGGIIICGECIKNDVNAPAPLNCQGASCGSFPQTLPINDAASAQEALCTNVNGVKVRQLARQLTSAALNCLFSNAFDGTTCVGNPGGVDFATCNAVCAGAVGNGPPNTTKTVEQCINELDCFNNGLAINPDGTCGGSTGCHTGELPLCDPKFGVNVNLPNCSGNCRFDTCKDPDTGLGRQGPAGSDDECQGINSKGGAISTPCTVVGATEGCCCKDSCGSLPATPNSCKNYVANNCK